MHVSNICISSGTTHRNTNVKITKESSYQERLERASRSKDINFISDHAYTSFREINELHDEIASIHNIRLQRTNTSEQIPVLKSNIHGQYYDPIEKIKWHLLPMDKSGTIFKNNTIKICLRGDKTLVKNKSLFNFCFCLPDGPDSKMASGQHTIGVFGIRVDNYKTLKEALNEIAASMKKSNAKIELCGKVYSIDWHLSGDMVFMKTERGLDGCGSNYPCFKCRLHKEHFSDENHIVSKKLLRSVEESDIFRNRGKKFREGYVNPPIFSFIKFENCHHDTLHESMNVVRVLINHVWRKLIREDGSNSTDLEKLPAQKKFIDWLESIGIKNHYREKGQFSKNSDPNFFLKSFSGSKAKKVAKLINAKALSSLSDGQKIAALFNDYYRLHFGYCHNFYFEKTDLLQQRMYQWKKDFNFLFEKSKHTPYLHILTDHVPDSIKKHGDLDVYNIQGLEKLNDQTTAEYFRGTNRKQDDVQQLAMFRGRNEVHRRNHPCITKDTKPNRNKLRKLAFLINTDLFTVNNLARLDDLMFNRTITTNTASTTIPFTKETTSTETSTPCSSSTVLGLSSPKITSDSTFEFNDNTIQDNNEIIIMNDESSEESDDPQTVTPKKNEYIFYHRGDMMLTYKDILTCRNNSFFSDICIEAFMKSFNNKKMFVLSYLQANKLALSSNLDEINLSIKVKYTLKCKSAYL